MKNKISVDLPKYADFEVFFCKSWAAFCKAIRSARRAFCKGEMDR